MYMRARIRNLETENRMLLHKVHMLNQRLEATLLASCTRLRPTEPSSVMIGPHDRTDYHIPAADPYPVPHRNMAGHMEPGKPPKSPFVVRIALVYVVADVQLHMCPNRHRSMTTMLCPAPLVLLNLAAAPWMTETGWLVFCRSWEEDMFPPEL